MDIRSSELRALVEFVEARVAEARRWLPLLDDGLKDVYELAGLLVSQLRKQMRDGHFVISARRCLVLLMAARVDEDHPAFDPAWLTLERRILSTT